MPGAKLGSSKSLVSGGSGWVRRCRICSGGISSGIRGRVRRGCCGGDEASQKHRSGDSCDCFCKVLASIIGIVGELLVDPCIDLRNVRKPNRSVCGDAGITFRIRAEG